MEQEYPCADVRELPDNRRLVRQRLFRRPMQCSNVLGATVQFEQGLAIRLLWVKLERGMKGIARTRMCSLLSNTRCDLRKRAIIFDPIGFAAMTSHYGEFDERQPDKVAMPSPNTTARLPPPRSSPGSEQPRSLRSPRERRIISHSRHAFQARSR